MRERLAGLVGTTRRARWITAATAVAIVVAVIAFLTLPTDDQGIPRDEYTLAAEQICLEAKRQILASSRLARAGEDPAGTSEYARALLPAVSGWRLQLDDLEVPADRKEQAAQLTAALKEAEARIAGLVRTAEEGNRRRTLASAAAADDASTRVEEAVAALGLEECAELRLGTVPEQG
ncbi:MAG TPA: hypothetical protein VF245_00170 [Solirubrobacterales bacterium]